MMRRIDSKSVSTFLLLQYTGPTQVFNFEAIHYTLITRDVIQERKPLSPDARRAGWIGCNIILGAIPPEGRIPIIENGQVLPKESRRALFAATERLANQTASNRNWSRALLNCLHKLPNSWFSLDEVYHFESELSELYPANQNIRPKIRQQLQVLRDAGLLEFLGRGKYRLGGTNS
jgi:type II restriction enzyme